MRNALILMTLLTLFGGCASRWNEKTCSETDFSQLGYQEGSAGQTSKINAYNQSCFKKKVQIPMQDYTTGYQKGLAVFCSPSKGFTDGSKGAQMLNNCTSITAYTSAHRNGLKGFCSIEKGVQDGFAMRQEVILCTSFSAYTIGYKKGRKEYCTSDRGYEHGFAGRNKDSRCVVYSAYKSGYAKGQKYYCSPENGTKLGEKGSTFPQKCEQSGQTFRKNYNRGRVKFLTRAIRDKETSITFERQNYERVRDELQDTQFELGRLPKYSNDPDVENRRSKIDSNISDLKSRRDNQRQNLETLESELFEMKNEVNKLKTY
jgi:hypothetical protein